MAEQQVDDIVIPILREIGCSFAGETKTLAGFKSEELVQAAALMVMKIKPEQPVPHRLPKSKAARFRICTTVSNAIQELGYQGDLGYEKFLYPTDADTRKVLIWLMNKLPKADEEAAETDAANDSSVSILAALKSWYQKKYNPYESPHPASKARSLSTITMMTPERASEADCSKYEKTYIRKYQLPASTQPLQHPTLAPSVMELNTTEICLAQERQAAFDQGERSSAEKLEFINAMMSQAFSTERRMAEQRGKKLQDVMEDIAKAYGNSGGGGGSDADGTQGAGGKGAESQFSRKTAFEQESSDSAQVVQDGTVKQVTEEGEEVKEEDEDAIKEKQEKRLAELQDEIKGIEDKIQTINKKMEEFTSTARQISSDVNSNEKEVKDLLEKYTLKKRTLKLLPDAEENLKKLQQICDDTEARILKMGDQWEKWRAPQIEKFRREKQLLNDRKNEVRKKVDAIRRMRSEMKQMVQDIRKKDEQYKQLVAELNKMPKSINRQVYIRRIMDIMKNLDKQKLQIKNILNDVRGVQRDINSVSDTSGRSFDICEKVVFDAAKSSDRGSASAGLKAYENLATLREGFDSLVKTVEDTGRTKNEIRAYETQIEALEAQNTGLNMKRVEGDLKQIKVENKQLATKLRSLKAGN